MGAKRVVAIAVAAVAILGGLPVLALAVAHLPPVRPLLANALESALSGPGTRAEASDVALNWPLDAAIGRLVLHDSRGPWLRLEGVRLDWSPSRLLRGEALIHSLEVEQARMLRPPVAEAGEAAEPAGATLPELPVSLRIERLAANIEMDSAVPGGPASLALAGRGRLAEGRAQLVADVERRDGGGAGAHVALDYSARQDRLAVDLSLDPAAGRTIAALAGLDALPALALTLSGAGPAHDWRGSFAALSGERSCLSGKVGLGLAGAMTASLDGRADLACLGLEEAQPLWTGEVAFAGTATVLDGGVRLHTAAISGEGARLAASGTLSGEALDLAVEGEIADIARLVPTASGRLSLDGTLSGAPARPAARLHAALGAGAAGMFGWRNMEADVMITPVEEAWAVAGTGAARAPAWRGAGPPPLPLPERLGFGVLAEISPGSGTVRLAQARLDGGGMSLSAFGVAEEWGARSVLHAGLRINSLEKLAGGAVAGAANLRLAVSGDLTRPDLRIAALGTAPGLSTGIAQLDALLGGAPAASARLAVLPGAPVRLVEGVVAGSGGRLVAAGLVGADLALGWHMELPRIEALRPDLAGRASARGFAQGRIAAPLLAGELAARDVRVNDSQPVAVEAAFALRDLAGGPAGRIDGQVRSGALEARAAGDFAVSGAGVRLSGLTVRSQGGEAGGDLFISAEGRAEGRIVGSIADLAPWARLAGQEASGALRFDVALAARGGQAAKVQASGEGLTLAGTRVATMELRADLADLLAAPRGEGRIEAAGVTAGGVGLETLAIDAAGTGGELALRAEAAGQAGAPLRATLSGALRPAGDVRSLRLDALDLRHGSRRVRLVEPTTLSLGPRGYALAPAILDLAPGRVELAGRMEGDTIEARAELRAVPLDLVRLVLPERPFSGTASGTATLGGTRAAPQAVVSLRLARFGLVGQEQTEGRFNAELDAEWRDGRLVASAAAVGPSGLDLRAEGSMPLRLAGGFAVPPGGAVSARLRGTGDVARLTELLPLAGHRFAGALAADIRVGGSIAEPEITGQAAVTGGRYDNFEFGTAVREAELRLVARDPRSFAVSLAGSDGAGGRLQAQGSLDLPPEGGLRYILDGSLTDFRVVAIDLAQARAGGSLRLDGNEAAGKLVGNLAVDRGEVNIEARLPARVVRLDVVEVNRPRGAPRAPGEEAGGEDEEGGFGPEVALDIQLGVQRLAVRGRGLDSEWKGEAVVGGTISRPTLLGELVVVRGSYELLGRQFRLARGALVFDGNAPIDPRLDLVAGAKAGDVEALVNVTGDLSAPQIDFTSEPPYPSDEVLARLLFGRGRGELSTAQQVQLARAVTGLAVPGAGLDPVGRVREAFGLDVLEFGAGGGENGELGPTVSAGKYIGEDTFLKVEQGTGGPSVGVEVDIGRGLSVESEVGGRAGAGIGLNWRRDY